MKSLDKLRNKVEEDPVAIEDLSDQLSKSIDLHFENRNKITPE